MSQQYPQQQPQPGQQAGLQWGQQPPQQQKKRHWIRNGFLGFGAFIIVLTVFGAVSGADSDGTVAVTPSEPVQATVSGPAQAAAGRPAHAAKPKPAPDKALPEGVYHFGQTVKFDDGSTLTTEKPVKFTPAQFAFGGEKFKNHIKVKVTFANKSGKVFDPALTTGSMSSGDSEGDSVYQDGLDAPDNKLLPGKKVTWWMGYGVKDAKAATLTVSMGFLDYPDVIFTNEL